MSLGSEGLDRTLGTLRRDIVGLDDTVGLRTLLEGTAQELFHSSETCKRLPGQVGRLFVIKNGLTF